MNVFLDSTELYNDPFLKNYWHQLLLKICVEHGFCLFISRVVIEETKNNSIKEMNRLLSERRKNTKNLVKLLPLTNTVDEGITYDVNRFEQDYNNRYQELEQQGLIEIIEPDGELLAEVIDRAIKLRKPFAKKKDEFRDCVIWLSYVNKAKVDDLDECFFITGNTKDFYNKEKTDLHDELKCDSDKFKLFKSTKDLVHTIPYILHMTQEIETKEWVQKENIDNDYILTFINELQIEKVQSDVQDYFSNLQPYDIDEEFYEVGNIWVVYIDIIRISDLSIDIIEDEILCWGIIEMIADVEIEEYNPMADTSSEKYIYSGSRTFNIKALYNLVFTSGKTIKEFTLDNIEFIVL